MRSLLGRVVWWAWRSRHAFRVRVTTHGGESFEGVYAWRTRRDYVLALAGVYDKADRLQSLGWCEVPTVNVLCVVRLP